MENYGRELRMEVDIKIKRKVEKVTEFVETIKNMQEEAGAALRKAQEEMKQQVNKKRRKAEKQKKKDKMMLSMKDLVFKKRLAKKLVDQYMGSYIINEVVSTNIVKLQLPTLMKIHPVVNIS